MRIRRSMIFSKQGLRISRTYHQVFRWILPKFRPRWTGHDPKHLEIYVVFSVLTCYNCRFVKDYSKIEWPWTQLFKKDVISWNEEVTSVFQQLKEAMINLLVPALPDFSKQFVIKTDASGFGLGVVLKQEPLCCLLQSQTKLRCVHQISYVSKLMAFFSPLKNGAHTLLIDIL